MKDFRFVWTGWDDRDARDYILGAIYNAVMHAKGEEENGDYMVRLRVKGGGVYLAYWEDEVAMQFPYKELGTVKAAHVRIGSPALQKVSWFLDYTELDTDSDAHLYWCPRKKGMPYSLVPDSIYNREWCLYEGVYAPSRRMKWNPEGEDGKPLYRMGVPMNREKIVSEMLEASKR